MAIPASMTPEVARWILDNFPLLRKEWEELRTLAAQETTEEYCGDCGSITPIFNPDYPEAKSAACVNHQARIIRRLKQDTKGYLRDKDCTLLRETTGQQVRREI